MRQGGAKNFGLGQYFFKSLKPDFFYVLGCFGHFKFLGPRGGEKFWTRHLGGAKNFGRVIWGGRKFLDFDFFLILRENKGTRIKSFA